MALQKVLCRSSSLCGISEEQARFIYERLVETDEKFSKLYSIFSTCLLKTSRLRDATDDIALALNDFGTCEKINRSTKRQVLHFSELLATKNDLRDNKIRQFQSRLVNHLSQYNSICRNAKEEVKNLFSAKEKETNKRKQLEKIRNLTPFNRERIVKAEAALSSEISSVSRAQKELEEHAISFERQKLDDLKGILQEYVLLELAEHAMAIELLTQSFNKLDGIDVNRDLEDFKEILQTNPMSLRLLRLKSMEKEPKENIAKQQQEMSPTEVQDLYADESETSESTSEDTESNMSNENRN